MNSIIRQTARPSKTGEALKNINLQAHYTVIPFRLLNCFYVLIYALWLTIIVGRLL
jgi:hypothetical protein